ncbi:acetyl-CoA carboxylase biotin carboxyl carrier protein [bacterium]|jgi:acetyl-CoA carboxylase biotin carboxyl carrier protein|nr:acetyl-CoA carboxylase biotin carboxyl carrier protein [Gammaproteobacteria bacterium]MDA9603382.1 acetyl-CoA carboxylase biotin carboxyl carrier protein [bacterium]MDA9626478.1 acetyl-CoA carboxylase biotin carboxyl carrier protein [Pseudomonadota bacterium]MDA9620676.1 acetyl-CoA carboxylase biotin carboxyl carrier protein [bacterium]MDA9676137.1 acetyl-CoA carboxylase biotin carboxyl carrier protein [Pseudomonadota bacterium]|tara:strand:+ start:6412 stop:6831 length:420 start_codon:yes stop_codon:yes gene_type:complete
MDIRKIKKLIEMLQESDLMEIEVKEGEESVRIARGGQMISHSSQLSPPIIETVASPIATETLGASITSPIVGTFYRKPAPDKPAFIEVGDHVNVGDVVCIIEAMKMMNEIKSEFSGTVTAIKVDDGEPVEFDQQLIIVG